MVSLAGRMKMGIERRGIGTGAGGYGANGGFDPTSRYDPASMSRIADDEIDPEADLFGRTDDAASTSGILGLAAGSRGLMRASVDRIQRRMERNDGGGGDSAVDSVPLDRRRASKTAALCLVVMGCIVGASLGITYAAKSARVSRGGDAASAEDAMNPSQEDGAGGLSDLTSQGVRQFVPPPDDLAMKCAPLTVSTKHGWDECKSLCSSAECCFLPEGHWYSCREENSEDCSAYEYGCATLDHVENLGDGSTSALATDDSNAPYGGGGELSNAEVSGDDNADSTKKVTLPDAPDDLVLACSPQFGLAMPEGHDRCWELCKAAYGCCGFGMEPREGDCEMTNSQVCLAYEKPCVEFHEYHDSVLNEAKDKCHTAALSDFDGVDTCRNFCSGAMGCFGEDSKDEEPPLSTPSKLSNGRWCDQYGPCQSLLQLQDSNSSWFADTDAAKKSIDDACAKDYESCKNVCHPASCCFFSLDDEQRENSTATMSEACNDDPNTTKPVDCRHYDACKILYIPFQNGDQGDDINEGGSAAQETDSSMGEDGKPMDNQLSKISDVDKNMTAVNETCDEIKLRTADGVQACRESCAAFLCCFSSIESENCYDAQPEECELYSACEKVNVEETVDETSGVDGNAFGDGDHLFNTTKAAVDEACSDTSLSTEGGFQDCHSLCQQYMCCVIPEALAFNCTDTLNEHSCMPYSSCSSLVNAQNDVYTIHEEGGEGIGEQDDENEGSS